MKWPVKKLQAHKVTNSDHVLILTEVCFDRPNPVLPSNELRLKELCITSLLHLTFVTNSNEKYLICHVTQLCILTVSISNHIHVRIRHLI